MDILEELKKAILNYDSERATYLAKEIKEGLDLNKVLEVTTNAIRKVGDEFAEGKLWLPDLVGAANAMQSAMSIIEEEIKRRGGKKESLGTVVIGTVYGDIHDIGKNMVVAFLLAEGFEVYDLGVNVSAEEFIEAVKRHKADILAMSALMTTTAPEQKKVIEMLKKENLRDKVKVIVGGAAITEEFAQEIEADGYESTAVRAAKLAKKLIGK